jgi:hypothetical protein
LHQFSERRAQIYTPEDIRFAAKGKTLYATLLAWPEKQAVIKSLGPKRHLAGQDTQGDDARRGSSAEILSKRGRLEGRHAQTTGRATTRTC